MRKFRIFLGTALLLAVAGLSAFVVGHRQAIAITKTNTMTSKGFAFVELYTSEGCSSCPPADRLATRIQEQYKNDNVYIIAYHVDYWNHLGWKDAFSSAEYSQRQRAYANYLKTDGIYTPQMVVNGRTEFVGSDEKSLSAAIKQNLQKTPAGQLTFHNVKIAGGSVSLAYQATGTTNSNLLIAFVQKTAQIQVKAGENSGQMLSHSNIVRKLQTISLKLSGDASITLPGGFSRQDWEIIGFVQNTQSGEITAVQKASLTTGEPAETKTSEK